MASSTVGHCLRATLLQSVLSSKHPSCGRWCILEGASVDGRKVGESVFGGPAIWLLQTLLYSASIVTHSRTAKSSCIALGREDSCMQLQEGKHEHRLGHRLCHLRTPLVLYCVQCLLRFSHDWVSLMPTHNAQDVAYSFAAYHLRSVRVLLLEVKEDHVSPRIVCTAEGSEI